MDGQRQENGVQIGPAGQTEADIGHAQNGTHSQLLLAPLQRLHGGQRVLLLGAGGQRQTVDVDILKGNARVQRCVADTAGNGYPLPRAGGYARPVHRQADHCRAVLFAQRQHMLQHGGCAVDGVDDGLAVIDPQAPFQRLEVGGIQL